MKLAVLVITAIMITGGCTPPQIKPVSDTSSQKIYHANLETVYNHLLSRNPEARKLQDRKQSLDNRKRAIPSGITDQTLDAEYNALNGELESLKRDLYLKIQVAVKRLAERQKISCILDSSRCLIYYTSQGDLTGQLIDELDILDSRSDPVSR
mgnify:CR=1 FL=1